MIFSHSVLVTLNIHTGRLLLAVNLSIFKFAVVRLLVGWEAGKGKVILHGNSSDIKDSNQQRHTIDTQILSQAMLFREAFHAKIVVCGGK